MTRQEAFQTLQVYTTDPALIRHHLAVEAAMRAICRAYGAMTRNIQNEELWAITAILHDADYEITRNTPLQHTLYLEEKLGNVLPKEVMYAIKAHNYKVTKVQPVSAMDWALYTCDELTGFVIAAALDQKIKNISTVTPGMVIEKMNNTSFAKTVDRVQITSVEQTLKIPLQTYVEITLTAMKAIAPQLGFDG